MLFQLINNIIFVIPTIIDSFERAFEKLKTVIQFNYSECDTEIEALAKSQRQIRAKKNNNYSPDQNKSFTLSHKGIV